MPGRMAVFVLPVLPYIALCLARQVDLGWLTGWREHLINNRFIATSPAPGPREAQEHNQMAPRGITGKPASLFF